MAARREAAAERTRDRRSDTRSRVLSALPAIAFALFIVIQGGVVFALGIIALGVAALHELYSMMRRVAPIDVVGFLALAGMVLAALLGDQDQVLLVLACAFPVSFLLSFLRPRREHASWAIAVTLFGAVWVGLALAHGMLLRELPEGQGLLIDVLVGTFIGDSAAYFGGRLYGRRPLAPGISPNKTLEGLIAGFVGATAAFWFAGLYQDWLSGTDALIIGLTVALVAPIGDLFESLLKRDLDVKDTGALFGAHGGVLDRLDAVFFTVPAAYYVAVALGYG
jgi:phosphatidate cytidylyltransferase